MKQIEDNKLYNFQQVEELTGLKVSNLRYWAVRGQIPAKKIGRAWNLSGADIRELIAHGARGPEEDSSPSLDSEETMPDPAEDVYAVECAAFDLIKKLIGREPTDEEREEMLDFIRLFMRVCRTASPEDIDKYADFET